MTATRGASAFQVVPWATVDILRPFFDKGPDLIGGRLLDLPMLRGAWATSVDSAGAWYDISGHGHTLTYNGDPQFNYDGLVGYWDLDGTGDYFSRADEADNSITGTETYVAAAARGLTAGGWLWADVLGDWDYFMAKWDIVGVNERSFRLMQGLAANEEFWVSISVDCTATTGVSSTAGTFDAGRWHCAILQFVPSTSLALFLDGVWYVDTTSIPAQVCDSDAPLTVGARAGPNDEMDGRVAYPFLCAAACSDTQVEVFYHMTKRLFGH